MDRSGVFFKNKVFHAGIIELLSGLAEQHHQYHPFNLFDVDVRGFQRQQAIDQQFALRWRENADVLEVGNVATAVRVESPMLKLVKYACTSRGQVACDNSRRSSF